MIGLFLLLICVCLFLSVSGCRFYYDVNGKGPFDVSRISRQKQDLIDMICSPFFENRSYLELFLLKLRISREDIFTFQEKKNRLSFSPRLPRRELEDAIISLLISSLSLSKENLSKRQSIERTVVSTKHRNEILLEMK